MSTLDQSLDTTAEIATGGRTTVPLAGAVTSSDHKLIGRTLAGCSLVGLLGVAVAAVVLGVERVDGEEQLLRTGVLTQLFTTYRVGLVTVVLLPLMLGISVFAVPLQLGARALAVPRLAAAGLWAWLGGVVLLVIAVSNNGGPQGSNADMTELYLGAMVLTLAGLTAVAVTVATSVLTNRAPGMKLHRVPLFSWGALVASLGLVLVLPVAAGTHVLVYVDYRYTQQAFGGPSGIWDWTAYVFTGPVLGLFALFAVGAFAELLGVTLRKRLAMRSVALIGLGLVGTAAFAGIAQQGVVALPGEGTGLWPGVPLRIAAWDFVVDLLELVTWGLMTLVPVLGVALVAAAAALTARPDRSGEQPRPNLNAPFAFAVFGLGLVVLGMLGQATYGIQDLGLWGTVFEEGASVAVIYGAVLGGFGALTYWFPKASGRTMPQLPLFGLALLGGLAGALASVPYLIAGFADQPAAAPVWDYGGPGELWNVLATAGHALMGLVGLAFIGLVVRSWRTGDAAVDDPWGGQTLEWITSSPAPPGNFDETPLVKSPEPILDLAAASDEGNR